MSLTQSLKQQMVLSALASIMVSQREPESQDVEVLLDYRYEAAKHRYLNSRQPANKWRMITIRKAVSARDRIIKDYQNHRKSIRVEKDFNEFSVLLNKHQTKPEALTFIAEILSTLRRELDAVVQAEEQFHV